MVAVRGGQKTAVGFAEKSSYLCGVLGLLPRTAKGGKMPPGAGGEAL